MPDTTDLVNKSYQSIFKALSVYNKNVSDSYHGGIIELAKRVDTTVRSDRYGRELPKSDILSLIKDGQGELANWKTDTRMQMIRDIEMVVGQFPELELAANSALEAMCDGDIVNGGIKLSVTSKNQDLDANTYVDKLESKYRIKYHLRETVFKDTLKHGEYYVYVKRVSEIFNYVSKNKSSMDESVTLFESVYPSNGEKPSQKNNEQMKYLYEAADDILSKDPTIDTSNKDAKRIVNDMLKDIVVHPSFEQMLFEELGDVGMTYLAKDHGIKVNSGSNLFENVIDGYSEWDDSWDHTADSKAFDKIKGCYIKWMNATQVLPIKVGTVLVGYYYIHYGNTNISNKTSFANGVIDITQTTTLASSKDFMQQLADMLVTNLDLPFVKKNLDMVDEITAILMETQFRKKSVSFTYIPREDIVPFKINVDTDDAGNSMFSRSMFNARLYSMLLMSNIITILNNRPSRTYKVKRDPRTNNIASTIQQFKEKIYSKRIGVDDVWSYNGAMNKIGAPNDMVVPVDADGTPPFTKEYDEGANIPLNTELMEMTKKAAITLTGVPNAIINQQDEIEYSKLAQMAQLKLLDFVKSLKIDLNASTTALYRRLIQLEFQISEEDANQISVAIPDVRSNDITIISEMMQTFSNIFDQLVTVLLTQEEATTPEGKPSNIAKNLKYELMKVMIPSLDYVGIERIKKDVLMNSVSDELNDQRRSFSDFGDEDEIANEIGDQQS